MIDNCYKPEAALLSVADARQQIDRLLSPITGTEQLSLKNALGRVLSGSVYAPRPMPHDRNSAVDGYAFHSRDIDSNKPFRLSIAGTAWAGKPYPGAIRSGECIRIFTGAVVPESLDSVIMQEQVSASDRYAQFPAAASSGRFIREVGEDIVAGQLLCPSGKILGAFDLGVLAAAGIHSVTVVRPLQIAYFSTGDELVGIGEDLRPGHIYDSNRQLLHGLLAESYCRAADFGVIGDNRQALDSLFRQLYGTYDVIISTGGASVGEADFIAEALVGAGQLHLWKIAMKPGKPLVFGTMGKTYFFGLPGNPVSVAVVFQQIVMPALKRLVGIIPEQPLRLKATLRSPLKKERGRMEFQRGVLAQDFDGELRVTVTGSQGSHLLHNLSASNCYIVLPAECGNLAAGEPVWVEPFRIAV